ncbi:MAG: radical SAM protein [Deltaproteobacteria bacterium]|nr:radical SAM protein [Deltaproteobacteria bacterium]
MRREPFAELARERLGLERGRIDKQAPFRVALACPSTYPVGMSSLGLLQIYRMIQAEPGMACERFFLPDDAGSGLLDSGLWSYEGMNPLGDFPVVALAVAYELEVGGVVQLLEAGGIPALARDRDRRHPIVLAGGPLTFSNPLPLAPFVDAVLMGEADTLAVRALVAVREAEGRDRALAELAALDHVYVPVHHGEQLPALARCDIELLPAVAPIRTPATELSDMALVEAVRGCSRSCAYCVMRRAPGAGMRVVEAGRLLECIPPDAQRVGLVGAGVSDHPEILTILRSLAARDVHVGLSSLRPDRLDEPFVAALRDVGYRTLTTALDGASERLRQTLDRRTRADHLIRVAQLARQHHLARLKLYLMLGVPGETPDDVDECIQLVTELSRILPTALAVAPFCAKRNTPLDGQPFAGVDVVGQRLTQLRKGLRGRVDLRPASARWAWVEHVLAQGGPAEGLAVHQAVLAGGGFRRWQRALVS